MGKQQLIATVTTGENEDLVQRVRNNYPRARQLDMIAEAHAAHSNGRHRLWQDEQTGVILFLEREASGQSATGAPKLHQIPLRSAACPRVLADLMAPTLARLSSPADSYRARSEADRDIGALVQLFRVQLARMRTEYAVPDGLVQAIHALVERAGDEQQTTRRTAFLGWYLEHTYGDHRDGHERAEQDLGCDFEEGINTDLDYEFVARMIRAWSAYRERIRSKVPPPLLEDVPSGRGFGRKNLHWFYEFRALGRHLTEQQILQLRAELPWAEVTSDRLVLDQWSDLTEHPVFPSARQIVSRYFDAGLHFRQNGSRTLWLRIPAALADQVAPFTDGFGVTSTIVDDSLVLELHRQEEDGQGSYLYYDPRPWLEELLPLQGDLAVGDVRAPAIAWRAANESLSFTTASKRPPMPDGLDEDGLSPQLHALIRLLEEVP